MTRVDPSAPRCWATSQLVVRPFTPISSHSQRGSAGRNQIPKKHYGGSSWSHVITSGSNRLQTRRRAAAMAAGLEQQQQAQSTPGKDSLVELEHSEAAALEAYEEAEERFAEQKPDVVEDGPAPFAAYRPPVPASFRVQGTSVRVVAARKSYYTPRGMFHAVRDVSVDFTPGSITALLGPSGSGKTTLLRLIAGLESASSGHIYFDGYDVTALGVQERDVGFTFQGYALFNHMTVSRNIAFGPDVRKMDIDVDTRVKELLALTGLTGLEDRFPPQLSGGQRQRVALARALACGPRLLLLDEPFGALDPLVRKSLQRSLKEIVREIGVTTIMVTHDQEEAWELADRVVLFNAGSIEQIGQMEDIAARPCSPFVMNFVGDVVHLPATSQFIRRMGFPTDKPFVMLRPSDVQVFADWNHDRICPAVVLGKSYVGWTARYYLRFEDGVELDLIFSKKEDRSLYNFSLNQRIYLSCDPTQMMAFHPPELNDPLSEESILLSRRRRAEMNFRDSIVRLVGEGYEQPQGDPALAIDINYARLNEWLVDRKVVPRDWGSRLRALHAAVAEAAPKESLPQGWTPYQLARARADETRDGATRSLLGGLKGEAGIWDRLAKAYEARALHIAEAGQRLARDADYEVPGIKRAMARAQQQLADLERRVRDARKGATRAEEAYKTECQRLAVMSGTNAAAALVASAAAGLKPRLQVCVEAVREPGVGQALELYAESVYRMVNSSSRRKGQDDAARSSSGNLLPTLDAVRSGGTEPPAELQQVSLNGDIKEPESQAPSAEPPSTPNEGPIEISWDFGGLEDENGESTASGASGEAEEISWDIELENDAATVPLSDTDGGRDTVEETLETLYGPDPAVQRLGEDAAYRLALGDDLMELCAFLSQRLAESRSGTVVVNDTATPEELSQLLQAVEVARDRLLDPELTRLLLLRSNPSFLGRQASTLESKRDAAPKLLRSADEAEHRRAAVQRTLAGDAQTLQDTLDSMRERKAFVESALGAVVKRRIIINGEINNLLMATA